MIHSALRNDGLQSRIDRGNHIAKTAHKYMFLRQKLRVRGQYDRTFVGDLEHCVHHYPLYVCIKFSVHGWVFTCILKCMECSLLIQCLISF